MGDEYSGILIFMGIYLIFNVVCNKLIFKMFVIIILFMEELEDVLKIELLDFKEWVVVDFGNVFICFVLRLMICVWVGKEFSCNDGWYIDNIWMVENIFMMVIVFRFVLLVLYLIVGVFLFMCGCICEGIKKV